MVSDNIDTIPLGGVRKVLPSNCMSQFNTLSVSKKICRYIKRVYICFPSNILRLFFCCNFEASYITHFILPTYELWKFMFDLSIKFHINSCQMNVMGKLGEKGILINVIIKMPKEQKLILL